MFHTFSCLAIGSSMIGQPCLTYQITKNAQGVIQSIPVLSQVNTSGGILGTTTSLIGALYANPPVRTADYLASVGQGLGIVKVANAQVGGSGADVLSPILSLWQVSRNISYLIMIIIFVVIGLMVMFRNRINPQTVITAQAALPGLVIGLILITFSYFLAGLMTDTAFISTNLVGAYFSAVRNKPIDPANPDKQQNLVQALSTESVIKSFSRFTGIVTKDNASDALSSIWNVLGKETRSLLTVLASAFMFQYTFQTTGVAAVIPQVGQGIQAGLATAAGIAAADNPTAVIGLVLSLLASIVLLYQMLRLLLRLVTNFLNIIFLTVSAPFQFLFASLPGRQSIATHWILNMLGNILAFPAVIAVFYFVTFLLGQGSKGPFIVTQANQMQNSNLISTVYAQGTINIVNQTTLPLLGGINLEFVRILVAFGALIALPTIPDLIKRAIGTVSQAGQMIGQEISSGIGSGQRYSGQAQQGFGTIGEKGSGLYNKPGYMITGYNDDGTPKYGLSKYHTNIGAIGRTKAWWANRGKHITPD